MADTDRCEWWNARGYGRCVLAKGHDPVNNGAGIVYQHKYEDRGSFGALDVYESERADAAVSTNAE